MKKRGNTTRFPTRIPAATSPTLGEGQSLVQCLVRTGKTCVHSPTRDKLNVSSSLPLLIPLYTTRSMLAVRALVFGQYSSLSFQL